MRVFHEYCPKVFTRYGNMVELEPTLKGYRSVFGFSETDANAIKESKSSTNFNIYMQYADTFFVDLDDGESSVTTLKTFLKSKDISFELYRSGNKGYHFHIAMEPIYSLDASHSCKLFAEKLASKLHIDLDLSIYRASSLIRLVGTLHEKTGRPKEIVDVHIGNPIKVPLITKPIFSLEIEPSSSASFFKVMTRLATTREEPMLGTRHSTLWSIATNCMEAGLSFDCALELLEGLNNTWENAKSLDEVVRAVKQAYQKT